MKGGGGGGEARVVAGRMRISSGAVAEAVAVAGRRRWRRLVGRGREEITTRIFYAPLAASSQRLSMQSRDGTARRPGDFIGHISQAGGPTLSPAALGSRHISCIIQHSEYHNTRGAPPSTLSGRRGMSVLSHLFAVPGQEQTAFYLPPPHS